MKNNEINIFDDEQDFELDLEETQTTQKKKHNKIFTIFGVTFIVTFAFFAFAIKNFSPEIDVEISKPDETVANEEKGSIDERLRWIQFEDNMPGVSTRFEENNRQPEEPVAEIEAKVEYLDDTGNALDNVPNDEDNAALKQQLQQNKKMEAEGKTNVQQPQQNQQTPEVVPVPTAKVSKVYVGQFSTIEQAITMQNKLVDSNLNVAPFVKKVGGVYVVQIGSFVSPDKAYQAVSELQSAGFTARIVTE